MGQYTFALENLPEIYSELEPLFRDHYREMTARLEGQGIKVSPYKPRLDEYFKASRGGWLKTFVVRLDGKACGYSNIYVTNDMHNGDLIAQEDLLYVAPAHRNGVGRAFTKYGLVVMRQLGVKRLTVSAVTDLRVAKLWKRMGFKELATQMQYSFEG